MSGFRRRKKLLKSSSFHFISPVTSFSQIPERLTAFQDFLSFSLWVYILVRCVVPAAPEEFSKQTPC